MISSNEEKPFSIYRCEVCRGRGRVNYDKQICHACNGKGYIVLDNMTGHEVLTVEKEIKSTERIYGNK